jgi:hypothetical protein
MKIKLRTIPKVPIPVRAVDFVMYCAQDSLKLRSWYKKMSASSAARNGMSSGPSSQPNR